MDELPMQPQPAAPRITPAARPRARRLRLGLLVGAPLLMAVVAGWFWATGGRWVSTDNAYVKFDKVWIAPEVGGRVEEVAVGDNQVVHRDEVLFRIDDRDFRLALEQADATLAQIRGDILAQEATCRGKKAEIERTRADIALARRTLVRQRQLAASRAAPRAMLDDAQHALDVATAELTMHEAELADLVAKLDGDPAIDPTAHSRYREATARRDRAALDLSRTVVRAPADGVVTRVEGLRPGDVVKAGDAAFALVGAERVWVEANFKETQLTFVRAGQPVDVTVDTYPGRVWHGRVGSIAPSTGAEFSVLPAENATGNWVEVVQRVPVRVEIEAAGGEAPLRSGMSADIAIDTGHRRELPGFVRQALAVVPGGG